MKKGIFFVAVLAILALISSIFAKQTDPKTVSSVDLNRYTGKWFEIARYPNRFQKQCVGNVTAEYSLQSNNRITVINKCLVKNGKIDEAEGEAKIIDTQSNSKLKVRFAPKFLSFLPFVWGDYWILDLGQNYDYALLGSPDRNYLWILSRTPNLDSATYEKLLQTAKREGFNADRLVKTQQN